MWTVENTYVEIEKGGVDTVIIPVGAIEQHGPHLPLGTDWIIAEAMGRTLGQEVGAYVLPALPVSNSQEHLSFKGSVSIRPTTLALVLEDICLSLRHQGFRKIVILSAHGGNWIIKPWIRDFNFRYPDMMVIHSSGSMPGDKKSIPVEIHSGQGETSAMLAIRPDLVKEGAADFTPSLGREYLDYTDFRQLSPTGVWGQPSKADGKAGKERAADWVKRSAEYIRATFTQLATMRQAK
jgi:creatinine amidohydrolase